MRVDYLGVQAFVSIAEQGSFRQAAAHLNISQAALIPRMRKFEEYLGVKLMTRTTRMITLTPAGLDLLPSAQRSLSGLEQTLEGLRRAGQPQQSELSIGCLPTLANYFLPPILKIFSDIHPELTIRIFDNSVSEIADRVESGAAEFGITILSINRFDVEVISLMRESFVVVAPRSHRLTNQKSVDCADLVDCPMVRISSQAGNRLLIDDALRNRYELDWRFEVQHVSTALKMVDAGNGLAIVPRLSVDFDTNATLVAMPLRNPNISRLIGITRRRDSQLTPAAQELIGMVQKAVRTIHSPGVTC